MAQEVLSLYRYYLMMRHMQSRFLHELGSGNWHELAALDARYLPFLLRTDPPAIFLNLWQATLYVLIEGWQKAGMENVQIDALLKSPNVQALRLHRHGTFHYHEDITPPLYSKLLRSDDAVEWTHHLSAAFHAYFDQQKLSAEFREGAKNC